MNASQLSSRPLNVSPFLSSTRIVFPFAALSSESGSCRATSHQSSARGSIHRPNNKQSQLTHHGYCYSVVDGSSSSDVQRGPMLDASIKLPRDKLHLRGTPITQNNERETINKTRRSPEEERDRAETRRRPTSPCSNGLDTLACVSTADCNRRERGASFAVDVPPTP